MDTLCVYVCVRARVRASPLPPSSVAGLYFSLLLDDERPHVVARLLVVGDVRAVAEREGAGPPAPAVDGLLLDVGGGHGVDDLKREKGRE